MPDPTPERIAGTFYSVEDLMNLPEEIPVDPDKAHEVSRALPVKLWVSREALAALLEEGIEAIRANLADAPPEEVRQGEMLIAQRRLWIRHLEGAGEDEAYIGLFPASLAGDDFDDEAAIKAE